MVEEVDIIGNRRLRKDDILYYVQTRPGDTVQRSPGCARPADDSYRLAFSTRSEPASIRKMLRAAVLRVIFEVAELPIIRDLQFEGLKSVPESDVLKTFRERRVGVSKESILDPVKLKNAERVLKELLAANGHPNAVVTSSIEEVSATSSAITFVINEGERVRVAEIQFEGSKVFKSGELRGQMKYVKEAGLISRFKELDILDRAEARLRPAPRRQLHEVEGISAGASRRAADRRPRQARTGFPILPLPFHFFGR